MEGRCVSWLAVELKYQEPFAKPKLKPKQNRRLHLELIAQLNICKCYILLSTHWYKNSFHVLQCTDMLMPYGLLRYHQKLHPSLNLFSVFGVMPDGERSIVWAKVVTKTINKFWASTDQHIDAQHVPEWYKNTKGDMCRPTKDQKAVKRGLGCTGWARCSYTILLYHTYFRCIIW